MGYEILRKNINDKKFESLVKSCQEAGFTAKINSRYILNREDSSLVTILGSIKEGNAYAILVDKENPRVDKIREIFHR